MNNISVESGTNSTLGQRALSTVRTAEVPGYLRVRNLSLEPLVCITRRPFGTIYSLIEKIPTLVF